MSQDVVRPDDFGKDFGLVHEAVVTGRRIGAGKEFWSRLAHDSDLFARVVAIVLGGGKPQSVDQKTEKRDLAEERRAWFADWYASLGFKIEVPKPNVSNREFARRQGAGEALFYRPSTGQLSYGAFMKSVRQGEHWTLTHADREKIGWEPADTGYWFWAEVSGQCPRLGQTWNQLSREIQMLSLEEYVVVWHAHKVQAGIMLDRNTWCWLRTRFGPGALVASGCNSKVSVDRNDTVNLDCIFDSRGGRRAEVAGSCLPAGAH